MYDIRYFSTNGAAPRVPFGEALLNGIAPDGGLYLPERLPRVAPETLRRFIGMPYSAIARAVLEPFIDIHGDELQALSDDAYDFPVPLETVDERRFILRLDGGPTCSFKDFAARLMARLFSKYLARRKRKMIILTATSGDTGSAVASAFQGVANIRVVVLFPQDEDSPRQRLQMTTIGGNITAVAVKGKFDDCQALVKRAFADPELARYNLSSANSINIGRLLPQTVYYFYAWSRLPRPGEVVFAVPCGNFGDISAGLLAKRMGLPVRRFIAATNANDEFPEFLRSGAYRPIAPSKICLSNAMNVGHPSNLARIVHLHGGSMDAAGALRRQPDMNRLRAEFASAAVSDDATRRAIGTAYREHGVILEPHGAVAWAAAAQLTRQDDTTVVILETAHPAKFPEAVEAQLGINIPLPPPLAHLDPARDHALAMLAEYGALKDVLRELV